MNIELFLKETSDNSTLSFDTFSPHGENERMSLGESDPAMLLRHMQPRADERRFVFCTVDASRLEQLTVTPIGVFNELEGTTLILDKNDADKVSLPYGPVWSLITLAIHSNLTAVGFLASVAVALANVGISVNVVSGYYHDHLFVLYPERELAMEVLKNLSNGSEND